MNKYDLQLLGIFIIGLLLTVSIVYIQDVFATGGAGIIAEKIMSQLQDALTYLNEGDNQAAAQEIENAINELKDTYESDKEE
jgi:Tfp pilus assembly protein PilF